MVVYTDYGNHGYDSGVGHSDSYDDHHHSNVNHYNHHDYGHDHDLLPIDHGIHDQDSYHMEQEMLGALYIMHGNADVMMSYPDPLVHSANYHPEPFFDDYHSGEIPNNSFGYTQDTYGGIMPVNDVDVMVGVKNGMLEDNSQLGQIIAMGEILGTPHVNSGDEVRTESAKLDFLHQHGYTTVPAGYELHHIVPLSQGGADNPQNMILLTHEQHDVVTQAHRHFYGW